jgi:hypothetical protein
MGNVNMHSTDESTCTKPYGVTQVVRNFLGGGTRSQDIMVACCLVALVVLIFLYRYDAQERDLDRYDDGQRQEKVDKELADIRSDLKVDHELIQAYGLRKAVEESDGRAHHHP